MLKGLTKAELDKVDELVESLDISIAEAVDIIKADKEINQGKRVEFDPFWENWLPEGDSVI